MNQVSDPLCVAPQLTADDIRQAKARGFTAIVNNRRDCEKPVQPSAADNRHAAEGEGFDYSHISVVPGQLSEDRVRAFQTALSQLAVRCWPIATPAPAPLPSKS